MVLKSWSNLDLLINVDKISNVLLPSQVFFVTCCGQTQIKTPMAGEKMTGGFLLLLEQMWSANS